VGPVIGTAAIRAECNIVAPEFVGHHDARLTPSAHQLAEKPPGSSGISPFLDKDFQHVATIINSPPKPMLLAANGDHHFIKVSFVASRRTAAPDLRGDLRSKPIDPNSDRLVADGNTTRSQKILNILKAPGDYATQNFHTSQRYRQRYAEASMFHPRAHTFAPLTCPPANP
jgi:hypothetical protein